MHAQHCFARSRKLRLGIPFLAHPPRSTAQYFTALLYILRLLEPRFSCQNPCLAFRCHVTLSHSLKSSLVSLDFIGRHRGHLEALCNSIPLIEFSLLLVVCTTSKVVGRRNRFHRVSRSNSFFSFWSDSKIQSILLLLFIFLKGYFLFWLIWRKEI